MGNKSHKVENRKSIAPYLFTAYKESLIRSLIIKQYGSMILIKLPSGLFSVMHELGLGNPEVEVIYKCELLEKLPNVFSTKLEAKAYILDTLSGKIQDFLL